MKVLMCMGSICIVIRFFFRFIFDCVVFIEGFFDFFLLLFFDIFLGEGKVNMIGRRFFVFSLICINIVY